VVRVAAETQNPLVNPSHPFPDGGDIVVWPDLVDLPDLSFDLPRDGTRWRAHQIERHPSVEAVSDIKPDRTRIEGECDERPVEYSLLSRPSQRIVQERLTNALSLCFWDGFARILVPPEWALIARDIAPDKGKQPAVQPEAVAPDLAGVVAALQGAVDTLRQQLVRADARADELRAEYDQVRADAQEARQEVGTLRLAAAAEQSRAEALRERLDASEARARAAEQAAEQAREHVREAETAIAKLRQVEETRRGQGRWARLRAAGRGEE
jgi:hypothetical protein